jgi:uncharacterized protein (UPF0371 family)
MFLHKQTGNGEEIAIVNNAELTEVREHKDAYALTFKLPDGKIVTGWRGQSLGKPELGTCSIYVKADDHAERGNDGTWKIGFPEVSDVNPFA